MSCTKINGEACTRCCESLGISGAVGKMFYINLWKRFKDKSRKMNYIDEGLLRSYFTPISKRRAKKINKHAVATFDNKAVWFKCKMLKKGVGCTAYENRPDICKTYTGGLEYSNTCTSDIKRDNVFFRG